MPCVFVLVWLIFQDGPAGGGIKQTFTVEFAGTHAVTLDIAATNLDISAIDSTGRFELFVNDELVDMVDFEGISVQPNEIIRDTMSGTVPLLSGGDHTIRVLVTRPYLAITPHLSVHRQCLEDAH